MSCVIKDYILSPWQPGQTVPSTVKSKLKDIFIKTECQFGLASLEGSWVDVQSQTEVIAVVFLAVLSWDNVKTTGLFWCEESSTLVTLHTYFNSGHSCCSLQWTAQTDKQAKKVTDSNKTSSDIHNPKFNTILKQQIYVLWTLLCWAHNHTTSHITHNKSKCSIQYC